MNPFHNAWGMICLWLLLLLNSITYANTDKFDLDTLLEGTDHPSAIEQLDGLLESLDYTRDVELWTITLVRAARLRALESQHKQALDFLRSKSWPEDLLANTVLKIATSNEIEHYLNHKSWGLVPHSGRNEALAGKHVSEYHQLTTDLGNYYRSAFDDALDNAITLKQASAYFTPSEYPEHIRGYLADLVASRWIDFLSDDLYWTQREQKQLRNIDLAALLTLGARDDLELSGAHLHPLNRIKAISERLYYWHKRAGRKEAALEVYRLYVVLLNRHFSTAEETEVLSQSLTEAVKALGAQYPWWTVGQYQLSLFRQQMPHASALLEAHDLAVQASIAHPTSHGAKLSKALLRELEYQEFSVSGQRSSAIGQASLKVDYRNLYRLYFKAWKVSEPLPVSLEEGELRVVVDELLKQPATVEWKAELSDYSDLRHHETHLVPQIEEHGQWLLMVSPQAEFADVTEKVQLLNLHLSHYVASVSYHNGEFRVATYDGRRGRALPNIVVELVEVTDESTVVLTSDKSNVHGIATLSRTKDADHYQIRLRHGVDSSVIEIPGLLGLKDEQRWSLKPAKAVVFTDQLSYEPGDLIHWTMLVKAGERNTQSAPHVLADSAGWMKLYNPDNQLILQQQVTTDATGLASGTLQLDENIQEIDFGTWRLQSSWRGNKSINVSKTAESYLTIDTLSEHLSANQALTINGVARSDRSKLEEAYISWKLRRSGFKANGDLVSSVEISQGVSELINHQFKVPLVLSIHDESSALRYRFELQLDLMDDGQRLKTISTPFNVANDHHYFTIKSDQAFYETAVGINLAFSKTNSHWQGVAGSSEWFLYALNAPHKIDTEKKHETKEWILGALKKHGELNHNNQGLARLHLKGLEAGIYRLRLVDKQSTDSESVGTAEELDIIVVESDNINRLKAGEVLLAQKANVEVGDTLKLLAGSGTQNQWVRLNILKQGKLLASQMLSPGVHLLEFPVTKSHQGGLAFNLEWVEQNQINNKDIFVAVPWVSKHLTLSVTEQASGDHRLLKVTTSDGHALIHKKAQVLVHYSDIGTVNTSGEAINLSELYQQYQPSMIRLDNNGDSYPYYFRESRRIAPTAKSTLRYAEIRYSNKNNDAYLGKQSTFSMLPMMLVNNESALGQIGLSSNNKTLNTTSASTSVVASGQHKPLSIVQRGFLNENGEFQLVIPASLRGKQVRAHILVVTPTLETGQLSTTLR